MEMPVYNTGIELIDSKLTIEKLENGQYSLIAYDKKNTVRVASIMVKYDMTENGRYSYTGSAKVNGMDYNCMVITRTKLSSFISGDYKGDVFDTNDFISLIYGLKIINFYPLKK
jgi:hypothetical protein